MKLKTAIRALVYLLIYLGVPILAGELMDYAAGPILGIIYIFLLIPFGILKLIDFYRSNSGTTRLSRVFNVLFRVPLALFGLVCLVVGAAIIGWVLYNVFVERQKDYSGPTFITGLGSFGVSLPLILFGWLTLRSAFRRKPEVAMSPEEQEEFEHEEDDEEH